MSERALRSALGVLVGLVLVYTVVLFTRSDGRMDSGGAALARVLAGLREAELNSITIAGPSGTVELAGGPDGWTSNGFPAEPNAVDRLVEAVHGARVGDLIASNPANHARLGVAADSTLAMTLRPVDGSEVRLFVGKSGAAFTSGYVRLPDEDLVYLVDGGLRGAAARAPGDWRDRTVVALDTAMVRSVIVRRDGRETAVTREEAGWNVGGERADSATMVNLLRELTSLEASGFAADGEPFGEGEARSLTVLSAGGDTLAALELRMGADPVRLRRVGDPVVFHVSEFRADRITPSFDPSEQE